MLHYKLTSLAVRRAGTTVELPAIHGSVAAEKAYLKALRQMLRLIAVAVREDVLPVVEREIAQTAGQNRLYGDIEGDVFARLRNLAALFSNVAISKFNDIFRLERKRHTKAFAQQMKSALSVDLSAVLSDEDLEEYMATATTRNVELIRGLGQDAVQRIAQTITNALGAGLSVKDIKAQLKEDFGMSDRRAQLIARDQTAKFNSELNQIRHTQAGVKKYRWRTSKDERVRSRHRKLDGKIYAYGESTGAESGLPPGRPIRCRCVAIAIVEF